MEGADEHKIQDNGYFWVEERGDESGEGYTEGFYFTDNVFLCLNLGGRNMAAHFMISKL